MMGIVSGHPCDATLAVPLPRLRLTVRENDIDLTGPPGWLVQNQVTRVDLETEAAGIRLQVNG